MGPQRSVEENEAPQNLPEWMESVKEFLNLEIVTKEKFEEGEDGSKNLVWMTYTVTRKLSSWWSEEFMLPFDVLTWENPDSVFLSKLLSARSLIMLWTLTGDEVFLEIAWWGLSSISGKKQVKRRSMRATSATQVLKKLTWEEPLLKNEDRVDRVDVEWFRAFLSKNQMERDLAILNEQKALEDQKIINQTLDALFQDSLSSIVKINPQDVATMANNFWVALKEENIEFQINEVKSDDDYYAITISLDGMPSKVFLIANDEGLTGVEKNIIEYINEKTWLIVKKEDLVDRSVGQKYYIEKE